MTRAARPHGLARRIALVRRQLGLTQGAFARRIGVSRGTVGACEAGRLAPRATTLERLARVGGVTTDWLLRADRPAPGTAPGRDAGWTQAVALLQTAWQDPERRAVAVAVLRALQPERGAPGR